MKTDTRISVVREATFGGFLVQETDSGKILLSAVSWTGTQPRLVLDEVTEDWAQVLSERGKSVAKTLVIPFQDHVAANSFDQWLAH